MCILSAEHVLLASLIITLYAFRKTVVVDEAQPDSQHWACVSNEALKASNMFIIASYPSLNHILKIGYLVHNGSQRFCKLKVYKVPDSCLYLPGGDFLDLGPRFYFTIATTDVVVEVNSLCKSS